MADENTQFNYLLNAMEHAAQSKSPAQEGYGSKRRALLAHVRELERKAALWDAINSMWSYPGRTLEEVVHMVAAERTAGVPPSPAPRHATKESGDCPHWCRACAVERGAREGAPDVKEGGDAQP